MKEKRKRIQEENKKKKEVQKQEHKEKSLKGIQKKKESEVILQKIAKESAENNEVEDDDAQYYRDEVGEEPDEGEKNMHIVDSKYACRYFFLRLTSFRFI